MAIVSYLQLDHPALGTAGGSALHASIQAIYQKIGDNIADRLLLAVNLNDTATATVEHNFNCAFSELRYDLYLYNEITTELTRITSTSSPSLSQFTIVANGGDLTGSIDITNNSGSQRDLALVVFRDPIYLKDGDVKDIDITTTAPEDGQALVYEAASLKFKPGASGDASFKIQGVTDPNATIKGGYLLLDSGEELATYDGSGGASTDYGKDITVSLDTIFGGNPANGTTYYLYIDRNTLSTPVILSDNGRRVYAVVEANFHISTTVPELKNPQRYIPLGFIRSADAGTVWSGTGAAFGTTATRRHDSVAAFISEPERKSYQITTEVASNVTAHTLSGEPQIIELYYYNGTKKIGLNLNSHLLDKGAVNIEVSTLGLTFGGSQYVEVIAFYIPNLANNVVSLQHSFTSSWMSSTAVTTLAHGLNDAEDIKGYEVQEWDVTNTRYKNIDRSALVINYDSTNFYLDWTGLSPSANLRYRVVAGGTPIPAALPIQYGGFNKFVGFGPGSYVTLTAAIAAAAAGDSILVNKDTTEPTGDLNINVANIRIRSMPNVTVGMSGSMTNGLRVTAAKVRIEALQLSLNPSGAQSRGVSIEAADCWMDAKIEKLGAQTVTDGVHITSGGSRTYAKASIQVSAGAVTNLLTNNDGASHVDVWGG